MTAAPFLTHPKLELAGVRHAFFTRNGGVSTGIYDSLNLGLGSRDDPDHVGENRRRAAAVFGLGPEALLTCFQIHSPLVVTVPFDGPAPEAPAEADDEAGYLPLDLLVAEADFAEAVDEADICLCCRGWFCRGG